MSTITSSSPHVSPHVFALRDAYWDKHPIITNDAKIATDAIRNAYALIKYDARKKRSAIAFAADPLSGKSFALEIIQRMLRRDFPDRGILAYEPWAKTNTNVTDINRRQVWVPPSAGGFYESLLNAMGYQSKIQGSLEGKREQVRKAMRTLALPGMHLFFLIDEAQDLIEPEFCWLKQLINNLARQHGIGVTVVLFGQRELIKIRDFLRIHARSDLDGRFTLKMYAFEKMLGVEPLKQFLKGGDSGSEFPEGTGLSYTNFLWPVAFSCGFRLVSQAENFWMALLACEPKSKTGNGIEMQWIAEALSEFAETTRKLDSPDFAPNLALWKDAVTKCRYGR